MIKIIYVICFVFFCSCQGKPTSPVTLATKTLSSYDSSRVKLVILGITQDAGYPQAGCTQTCCTRDTRDSSNTGVVSLGLIDRAFGHTYLLEATPDLTNQLRYLDQTAGFKKPLPDAIFLTHAHIGHYTGLMYLGKEAMNAHSLPVYTMPRMQDFLRTNGPWSQLVDSNNIRLHELQEGVPVDLSPSLKITPFLVPHRDEYSETAGFLIEGPNKKALFIPDIDKWSKWERQIVDEVKKVDYAFIDATFYDGQEIKRRDISQIPHPFVIESLDLFEQLDTIERSKIIFIHFNHTNPLLQNTSDGFKTVRKKGYGIARTGQVYGL